MCRKKDEEQEQLASSQPKKASMETIVKAIGTLPTHVHAFFNPLTTDDFNFDAGQCQ